MKRPLALSLLLLLVFVAPLLSAADRTFPFTAQEDSDGARYVWFMYKEAGFYYDYLPAKDLLKSPRLKPAPGNKAQVGDVAWWKEFVAIYDPNVHKVYGVPEGNNLLSAPRALSLRDLERKFGPVRWLRYDKPEK